MIFAFDFARLSKPYRLKRCSYQMMHMCLAIERLGHKAIAVVSDEHLKQHRFLKRIKRLWHQGGFECDVYIGKSDAFYRDYNWEQIQHHPFKVCLCNSDMTFRESSRPFRSHRGTAVQTRCDLYMPANHTRKMIDKYKNKVHPVAHPIDPRMFKLLVNRGLYDAYINDDINVIRSKFANVETGRAGFFGSSRPYKTRRDLVSLFPSWVDFEWARTKQSDEYVTWLMGRRGCLDLKGNGDKSLRFTEAALLGRTIITTRRESQYVPTLVDGRNCILGNSWAEMKLEFDRQRWLEISQRATHDYLNGWSMLSQARVIVDRVK